MYLVCHNWDRSGLNYLHVTSVLQLYVVNLETPVLIQSNRNRTFLLQAEEAWHTFLTPFLLEQSPGGLVLY